MPKPAAETFKPEAKSARWHYERALIHHLRDEDGKATIELYRALEKEQNYPEASYLLGLLFEGRKRWEDAAKEMEKVVSISSEHVPARINLARARTENGELQKAIKELDATGALLKLGGDFSDKLNRCRNELFPQPNERRSPDILRQEVKDKLLKLVEAADDFLSDSPENFRTAVIERGIKDPILYTYLADSYQEQDDDSQTVAALVESLNARGGFAPAALLQLGRIFVKQEKLNEAIEVLEKAASQLNALGFSEAAGDYSTEEIKELRARAKSSKQTPKSRK